MIRGTLSGIRSEMERGSCLSEDRAWLREVLAAENLRAGGVLGSEVEKEYEEEIRRACEEGGEGEEEGEEEGEGGGEEKDGRKRMWVIGKAGEGEERKWRKIKGMGEFIKGMKGTV